MRRGRARGGVVHHPALRNQSSYRTNFGGSYLITMLTMLITYQSCPLATWQWCAPLVVGGAPPVPLVFPDLRYITITLPTYARAAILTHILTPAEQASGKPPAVLLCPITKGLMLDPAVDADGETYEWAAIEQALVFHPGSSPATNLPYPDGQARLTSNHTVRDMVVEFLERPNGERGALCVCFRWRERTDRRNDDRG
eukprot:4076646-Pyramimonas_sp.AAC.1